MAAVLHWYLCKKFGFECDDKYDNHIVTKENKVLENDEVLLLYDFTIQNETRINNYKRDIIVKSKKEKTCQIIDVACPFDTRVKQKEEARLDHCSDLKYQILKMLSATNGRFWPSPYVIPSSFNVNCNGYISYIMLQRQLRNPKRATRKSRSSGGLSTKCFLQNNQQTNFIRSALFSTVSNS